MSSSRFRNPRARRAYRHAGLMVATALANLSLLLLPISAAELPGDSPGFAELGIEPCRFVRPPPIIDGLIASKREMETMGDAMREYAASMQASLACLDNAAVPPEHKTLIDQLYNNGVDQLNFIVGEYNRQVAMYRRAESVSSISTN